MTPKPQRPSLAEAARTLAANGSDGALSTLRQDDGCPYGSLVDYLPLGNGDALFLFSRLAEHRRYLDADPRASLLIAPPAPGPRLMAARLTLTGRVERAEPRERYRDDYLARHPQAAAYIDFDDFDFYRLQVDRARFIAGFGRMAWLQQRDYRAAEPDPLAEVAAGAIRHMNDDHADSLRDYARAFAGVDTTRLDECRMSGLDRYGFDLDCSADSETRSLRIPFEPPLRRAAELRPVLSELARRARAQNL